MRKEMIHLLIWLAICTIFIRACDARQNISLPYPRCDNSGIPNTMSIRCYEDAHDGIVFNRTQDKYLPSVIQLTTDAENNVQTFSKGYVFWNTPVKMRDSRTGHAASFSTSFTFRIQWVYNHTDAGDGIVFVMLANGSWRGDAGVTLGIYKGNNGTPVPGTQGTKTLCVEFDTVYNPGVDPFNNSNHVGLDLESIKSKTTADAAKVGIDLKGGYPITAWIDYSYTQKNLEVRISKSSQTRPLDPLLNYTLNLAEIVDDHMTVGFAASTGSWFEHHELYNWTFVSFGLPERPPISTGFLVGIIVAGGSISIFIATLGCIAWRTRRKRAKRDGDRKKFQAELSRVDMPSQFTYKQLSAATGSFTEASKLGQGGSGSVYRGQITSEGAWVAVKKLVNTPERSQKEFLAELSVLSQLRHRNLVKLLGFCGDRQRGNYLIVYELMPKGSLDKVLYCSSEEILSWAQRFAIVRGVAEGLAYLHTGTSKQVIHRDIKSSNVMLDENYNAKLGDFGLARMIDNLKDAAEDATSILSTNVGLVRMIDHIQEASSLQLAGTFGYIAPESVTGGCTDKSDVYAFGVLILEIASARRPIDNSRPSEEMMLVNWVWTCYVTGRLLTIADPRLAGQFSTQEMVAFLKLGLLCSYPDPEDRPSMEDVKLILAGHRPLPEVPLVKPVVQISDPSHERLLKVLTKMRSQQQETLSRSSNMSSNPSPWSSLFRSISRI